MGDVHESDPSPCGKIVSSDPGSINIDGQIDEGRTIGLLMRSYAQGGNPVLDKAFIAQIVELALSRDLCQLLLEGGQVERSTNVIAELMFDSAIGIGFRAGDLDGIHFLKGRAFARG